jgi:predicted RNA binding protein YcfA (HicA-like mRNA interferase family)
MSQFMPDLPHLPGKDIVRILEQFGFVKVRQKGSHVVMKRSTPDGSIGCVVPMHDEVATGTLRSILRQARISPEEFKKMSN